MKYKVTDTGEVLEAEDLRHLAEALWQTKWDPEPTIEEWMAESARRCAMWDNSVIRTVSPEAHVEDLLACGFLERLEE